MKRLLSLILALVMTVSLLPSVAFAGTDEGVTVKYSFAGTYGDDPRVAINYGSTNGRFRYEGTNSVKTSFGYNGGLAYFDIRDGNYVAFRIRVPVAGEYNIKFDARDTGNCNKLTADMYVLPGNTADIAASLTTESLLIADICKVSGTYSYSAKKELIAGEYIVAFKRTGFADGGTVTEHAFRPKMLTLTSGEGTGKALIWAEMSPEDDSVFVGDTTSLTVRAYMSDGAEATLDEKEAIEYVSLDTDVATVSGTTVTAVGEGEVTIQAKSGNLLLAEAKINAEIRVPDAIASAELSFRADEIPVGYSDFAKLALASDKGGEYIDPYTVAYECTPEEFASIDENTGKLTALKTGEVTVTASITDAKQGNLTAAKTLQIVRAAAPSAQPVSINFNATAVRSKDYDEIAASGKTVYPIWAFDGGESFRVVEEKTTTYKTHLHVKNEGISAADGVTKTKSLLLLTTEGKRWAEGDGREGRITLKINMNTTEPGWYDVSLTGGKWASGGVWYVFFGDEYAGVFSNRDVDYPGNSPWAGFDARRLSTVYIEPDENGWAEMSFALADFGYTSNESAVNQSGRYGSGRLLISSLTLTPAVWWSNTDGVNVSAPRKMIVGETDGISAFTGDTSGKPAYFGEYNIGQEKLYDGSFSAEIISGDSIRITDANTYTDGALIGNAYDAKLSAVKAGETVLRFTAKKNGEEFTSDVTITVEEYPQLEEVKLTLDKTSVPVSRKTSASYELFRAGDGAEYTEAYELRYESSKPSVASVDEKTGEIEALSEGKTTIKLTVTDYKGNEVGAECEFTVTEKPVLEELVVTGRQSLLSDETTKLSVSGIMSDGIAAEMENYSVKFESTDESVITVDENGEVTSHKLGSAAVTVVAVNEKGIKCPKIITIDVVEALPDIVVDFSLTEEIEGRGIPTVTPGYTILTDVGNANYFRKFRCEDKEDRLYVFQIRTSSKDNVPWPECGDDEGTFAIAVNADAAGYYGMSVTGGLMYSGADYSVYVNDDYAGDVTFHQEDKENVKLFSGKEQKLNVVYLQKGENEIVFRFKKIYPGVTFEGKEYNVTTPNLYINNITFKAEKGDVSFKNIEMKEIPSQLAVGEVFEDTVSVRLSNGSTYAFGPSATGEALDSENGISMSVIGNSVTASGFEYEICNADKRSYSLTATKAGEAKVVFTVAVDGITNTFEYPIEIIDDELVGAGARCEADVLYAGDSAKLVPKAIFESGRESEGSQSVSAEYESLTPEIATVEDGMLVTHKEGTAKIKVYLVFRNAVTGETEAAEGTAKITVEPEGMAGIKASAGGSSKIRLTDKGKEDTVPLFVQAISNLGEKMDMTGAEVSAVALTDYAELSGLDILPVAEGKAQFEVMITTSDKRTRTETVTLDVVYGKSGGTYYTAEKVAAARENAKTYTWAKDTARDYAKKADKYLSHLETIYNLIPSEGIPRSICIGDYDDPNAFTCRYCNVDLVDKYGKLPWLNDPISRPWKTQCPDCKRLFPSNNFEGFYKLGINEYGEFDRMRALEAHRELFGDKSVTEPGVEHSAQWKAYYGYGVEGGYLYNELYKNVDLSKVETLNCGEGLREGETQETWGVDDSFGYIPSMPDGTPYTFTGSFVGTERHCYIAEYVAFGIWRRESNQNGAMIRDMVKDCSYAYLYTGDIKYGRAAAVILDRVADLYPGFDIDPLTDIFEVADGSSGHGGIMGNIIESAEVIHYMRAYDIVYDVYDDPFVVDFILKKGQNVKFRHAKETPSQIRTGIEDGILRTVLEGLRDHSINGNFGLAQKVNALAAVVLDSKEETEYWLDFMMAPGWHRTRDKEVTGGGIDDVLVGTIDADGQGNEGSQYNNGWHTGLLAIQDFLDSYDKYDKVNLYNHPKFVQMFYSNIPLTATNYPAIGDSGSTQGSGMWVQKDVMLQGWKNIGDPVFAQLLYKLNGNSAEGLNYGITEKNPERLEDEVKAVIEEYGEFDPQSEMMTNFGFGILRDGNDFTAAEGATAKDTRRDVWMYFGNNTGHAHLDTLNLGMNAFGLEILPDLGYPETTGTAPNRIQWVDGTLSHNTVMVNNRHQYNGIDQRGDAKHFSDDGTVAVMDVSTPYVYINSVDEYRRSVVMIKVNDEISYTVDFFRVLGLDDHQYSFHAASNSIAEHVGLGECVPQMENGKYAGTLAGIDVPYGPDPGTTSGTLEYPQGYTWIDTIDSYENPENKFEIDFEIKDFNRMVPNSDGIRLHMTMHNEENVANGGDISVKTGNGYPPQKEENKNIDKLKYVIVKNTGNELDTVFTTVLEPYRNNRYLTSSEELPMTVVDGTEADGAAHRALKITHESGRVDYVFYATDNSVTYKITDIIGGENRDIAFRGFVGVYTVNEAGANIYSYVNDGDIIGEETGKESAVTGVLKSFTKELSESNELVIVVRKNVSDDVLASLPGRYVFVENGAAVRSGTWKIEDAYMRGEDLVLDVGRITAIWKYVNSDAPEEGYVYTVTPGQNVRIPLTYSADSSPVFDEIQAGLTVSAGNSISVNVSANSPIEDNPPSVTYVAETLPRGASVNAETGTVTWKPDSSQIGDNHFAVTARDSDGRESTVHFIVTVYGSTTGGTTSDTTATETPSGGASGGGGGGGGAPDTGNNSDSTDVPNDENTTASDENTETSSDVSGETENIRFIDLGNHTWAADSINTLADDGIIKGTTHNTYSPANNITRADFALLLVRSFKLESDNAENFADVTAADYFASELAIARNTGIVQGIGENKYAPRDTITRQDMMVITYRAMQALSVAYSDSSPEGGAGIEGYSDIDSVAPYARDAVSALVGAGIINGKNGKIDTKATATRAEVAVMLNRVLDLVK